MSSYIIQTSDHFDSNVTYFINLKLVSLFIFNESSILPFEIQVNYISLQRSVSSSNVCKLFLQFTVVHVLDFMRTLEFCMIRALKYLYMFIHVYTYIYSFIILIKFHIYLLIIDNNFYYFIYNIMYEKFKVISVILKCIY